MTWPLATLKQLSMIGPQYGANLSAVAPNGRGVRYVRITDIDEFGQLRPDSYAEPNDGDISDYILADGDLLLARSGATVGKSYMHTDADGACVFAGYLIRFRPNRQLVLPKFLIYYTQTSGYWSWVNSKKRVAAQPNVNGAEYASLQIPLPPLREQHRIVELLDQADALRRLRRAADAKSARILPALFLEMFGDPATNPIGWETDRLDRLFDVCGGGTPPTTVAEYWQGDIPWVSPKDMKVDVITDTEDRISEQAIANSATKLVKKGSILIVYRSGILAHTFPVAIAGRDVTLNQDLKALNSKSDVSNDFIYGLLITAQRLALSYVKKGATVHNVDGARFMALQVPKPPKELLARFSSYLKDLIGFKNEYTAAASLVDEMFGVLLQKAYSGDLTAKWRQAHMQELLVEMQQQAKALNLPWAENAA